MAGNTVLPRVAVPGMLDLVDRMERSLNELEAAPLAGAVVLPPQTIGTTDTRVYHGLGRQVRYFWVVDAAADVRVFRGAVAETVDPANYISLRASSAATVSLAVF